MIEWFVIIPGFLIVLTVIGLVIFFILRIKRINVKENAPLIDVTARRQFTNGYTEGMIIKSIPRKNNTVFIKFYPFDVEQGDDVPRAEIQQVVIKKEYLRPLVMGDASSHRNKILVLPREISDLPKSMQNTLQEEYQTKESRNAFVQQAVGNSIKAGDKAILDVMMDYSRIGIGSGMVAHMKEQMAELAKAKQPGTNEEDKL